MALVFDHTKAEPMATTVTGTKKSRSERVRAAGSLIVWFCAGAFIASSIFGGVPAYWANLVDVLGGCIGAAVCLRLS